MKLSRDGALHRFYKWNFGKDAGDNFCPFFWKMLIAFLCLPLTTPGFWYKLKTSWQKEGFGTRLGIGIASYVIGAMTCIVLGILGVGIWQNPITLLYIIGAIIGGVVSIFLLIGIYILSNKALSSEVVTVISAKKESVLDRFCPKVDWTYKK